MAVEYGATLESDKHVKLGKLEISLADWLTSKWATMAFRTIVTFVCAIVIPAIGWMIWAGGGDARARVAVVESNVKTMLTTQDIRSIDAEKFQAEVRSLVMGVRADFKDQIGAVQADVFATKVDIGVIKNLLREMRQRDIASVQPDSTRPFPRDPRGRVLP